MWYCTKNCEDSLLDSFFMSILEAFHFLPIFIAFKYVESFDLWREKNYKSKGSATYCTMQ